jgi:outer membrane protein assembly factor BamB
MTAYDLNTGDVKWRIPTGQVNAPPDLNIPSNTGSHFPRSGPLVTAGGLIFFSTGSDRRLRAYDRESGKEVWSTELPATSEGMPATYAINGRQYIAVPVAAGTGQFAARFGGPAPAGRAGGAPPAAPAGGAQAPAAAPGDPPGQQAAARAGGAGQAGGRGGRGGAPALPAQYMVFALPQR